MLEIRIAAAAIVRSDGATLLVRKRGTLAFMQPGGKIDGGETALEALRRELWEELGLAIQPEDMVYIGRFTAPAANEPGCTVTAEVFKLTVNAEIRVQAEIEEARWVTQTTCRDVHLAPLTEHQILPLIWQRPHSDGQPSCLLN